jgi:ferric-dicitrate binding protein FerR (iron transport regulator)
LLAEVFRLIEEDPSGSVIIYDGKNLIGEVSCVEIMAFLNHKKDTGDIYHHKQNMELGTILHLIKGMRHQAAVTPLKPSASVDKSLVSRLALAAVIVAALLGVGWLYIKPSASVTGEPKIAVVNEAIGADKAVLNLGNGKLINISDAKVGLIYDDPEIEITKVCDTEIKYSARNGKAEASGRYANHTLTTPNGQQYQVVLSDGTKIWLNAGSSIKFPASFVSLNSRNVSLTGEAYFEVARRNYQPFLVAAKDQEIQVLGTHFNVNAYSNESRIKTTLLEGSVRVTDKTLMQSVLLKPQQQAVLVGSRLMVITTPADESAAWKDGEFIFRNMPLPDVMRVIERQYDVKVVYKKKEAKDSLLGGSILFSSKLADVLNMLELTSNAHFKIEGRRVNVM